MSENTRNNVPDEFARQVAKLVSGRVVCKNIAHGNFLTGISPCLQEQRSAVSVVVYIDNFYKQGLSAEQTAKHVMDACVSHPSPEIDVSWIEDYNRVSPKLTARLLHESFNAETVFRSAKPYGFPDLVLVPYVTFKQDGLGDCSVRVSNSLLSMWGVSKEQVVEQAVTQLEYKITPMDELLRGLSWIPFPIEVASSMLVVTNEQGNFGAASVIPAHKELGKMLGGDYVVLPSSVHECIVVRKDDVVDWELLKNIVAEVNRSNVLPQDKLSDNVYLFKV